MVVEVAPPVIGRMRTLAPGEVIEAQLDPRVLTGGMGPVERPETGTCRVQFRAEIYSSRRRWDVVATRTTGWSDVSCSELQWQPRELARAR